MPTDEERCSICQRPYPHDIAEDSDEPTHRWPEALFTDAMTNVEAVAALDALAAEVDALPPADSPWVRREFVLAAIEKARP